jgi:hypothetical protein
MGMAPVQADWTPPIQQVFHESFQPQFFSGLATSLQSIRGPPAL